MQSAQGFGIIQGDFIVCVPPQSVSGPFRRIFHMIYMSRAIHDEIGVVLHEDGVVICCAGATFCFCFYIDDSCKSSHCLF